MHTVTIHCDKCSSTNVKIERKQKVVKELHMSMSEYVEQRKNGFFEPDIYAFDTWYVFCNDCGHAIEFTD